MQLNGTAVVDRHNRPTVIQKVALRAFFINDGEYYDPNDISGVGKLQAELEAERQAKLRQRSMLQRIFLPEFMGNQ